ncbi:hypothetical protein BJV82DRAFT_397849 [Fennellomyces sp. T-0311]|nr:hypothetical protein BJV82DRAFT_397849 [Fennellomyces sp. T-0311]
MNIDDVNWCIANADNLTLRRFAEQFNYTNKHSANQRYSHILSSTAFKKCQNSTQLLTEFNVWKGSLEEVTFWGDYAINQEKLAADYALRCEGIKTAKQYAVEASEELRDSIRRRRSMRDL